MDGNNRFIKNLLELYCERNNLTLSPDHESIIQNILDRDGNCPCKPIDITCPCSGHLKAVEEKGRCHCGLFLKK